jgi:subtilisin-like proprotein convertase family protein
MRKIYSSFLSALAFLSVTTNQSSAQCLQNFDAVVAPALPAGWVATTNVSGVGTTAWVTTSGTSFNAPNSAFTNNPGDISDEWLDSEPFSIISASAVLSFRRSNNLENGFDGMVLEISIGGGAFQDILAAGGSFVNGGYNGSISANFGNPLASRQAWTGSSNGFVLTTVNLPAVANGQNIVLRFRRGTDNSVSATGAFIDNVVICGSACASVPPSTTDPVNATVCSGGNTSFTVTGSGTGITYQWQVNTGSGFNNVINGGVYSGATTSTLTLTGIPFTLNAAQFRVVVAGICSSVNSAPAILTVNRTLISAAAATPATVCSPGLAVITWTASGTSSGNYIHTLTGPGTIVQNASTGPKNENASFNVSAIPAGIQTYTLTSTGTEGCPVSTTISITVNATPVITLTQNPVPLCTGQTQQITIGVNPSTPQSFSQFSTIIVPDGNANPYPSQLTVSGLPTTGVTVKSVKLGNVNHTFPDDMDIVLVSPTGQAVIIMSDAGGGADEVALDYTFDDAAATTMADATLNPTGTFKPTNFGATDNFPSPGPGSLTQATPTLSTFTGNLNGDWKLYVVDDATGDVGFIGNWTITFNRPTPVVFSPVTGLFTDAAATIAYTGTPVIGSIYAKPTAASTVYTASATVAGCSATANVTVTVNQFPAITAQPSPATQTVCPGATVVYQVTATGTGISYQWRKGGVALVDGVQGSGSSVAGATTNFLTLTGVVLADAGNYDVVVSGTCTPAATSTASALLVASAPTITTQPANASVCDGASATFNVVAAGTPAPALYQWQVSTTAVPAFTSIGITTATPSLTLTNVTTAMSGNKYRVIVMNNCGQSVTSNGAATLTVNAKPIVTATALPARICLSDGPVALTGSPVGGSWSGIGVSGSNFVPSATAVGKYTLTYTYTNNLGCATSTTVVANVVSDAECGRIRLLRDNALILYPNPNNGNFNIRINSILYNYLNMKVFNAAGNLVNTRNYTGLVYGQVIPIDLSHLPSGSYMVRFFYDGGNRTSEKVFPVVIGRQ